MDLDQVFQLVGEFGRYQKLLLLLVCLPACIPCGFWIFNQVFMSMVPDHWCKVPAEYFPPDWSEQQRKLASIPFQDGKFSRCTFYDANYTTVDDFFSFNNTERSISECKYGWEFDTLQVPSSTLIDFELVCKNGIVPTVSLSVLNTASIIGVFIFGYLADKIGRRKSYFACLTTGIMGGIATALAPEVISWTASRFVVGLTVPAILQISLLMCLEFVGPTKRTFVSFLLNMYYAVGLLLLSGITFTVRDWRHLAFATSVPFIGFYVFLWFLPDTPRWLLIQQRWTEVGQFLEKLSSVNQAKLPTDFMAKLQGNQKGSSLENPASAGFYDLFRTPNMRLKTFVVSFCWVVCQTVFIGLGYYGPAMGTDGYLSFFLSCLVEMPGYLFSYIGMEKFGRRLSLCFFMIVSGLAALSTALTPPDMAMATLVLFLVAKLSIAGGIMVIFQYGGELYPTEVRGVGMGFSAAMGGVGLATVPYLNYLGSDWLTLPIVIMGVLNMLGGILALRLPETLNQPLPQTVQEGEAFGKDMTFSEGLFLSYCCKRNSEEGSDAEFKHRTGFDAPVEVFVPDENH